MDDDSDICGYIPSYYTPIIDKFAYSEFFANIFSFDSDGEKPSMVVGMVMHYWQLSSDKLKDFKLFRVPEEHANDDDPVRYGEPINWQQFVSGVLTQEIEEKDRDFILLDDYGVMENNWDFPEDTDFSHLFKTDKKEITKEDILLQIPFLEDIPVIDNIRNAFYSGMGSLIGYVSADTDKETGKYTIRVPKYPDDSIKIGTEDESGRIRIASIPLQFNTMARDFTEAHEVPVLMNFTTEIVDDKVKVTVSACLLKCFAGFEDFTRKTLKRMYSDYFHYNEISYAFFRDWRHKHGLE